MHLSSIPTRSIHTACAETNQPTKPNKPHEPSIVDSLPPIKRKNHSATNTEFQQTLLSLQANLPYYCCRRYKKSGPPVLSPEACPVVQSCHPAFTSGPPDWCCSSRRATPILIYHRAYEASRASGSVTHSKIEVENILWAHRMIPIGQNSPMAVHIAKKNKTKQNKLKTATILGSHSDE